MTALDASQRLADRYGSLFGDLIEDLVCQLDEGAQDGGSRRHFGMAVCRPDDDVTINKFDLRHTPGKQALLFQNTHSPNSGSLLAETIRNAASAPGGKQHTPISRKFSTGSEQSA
ncbi:MAG TPA: hypothetical protein VFS91_05200 [Nitrobacter sp.]|nr:hypothetical protein [Nitrobacter sp.]